MYLLAERKFITLRTRFLKFIYLYWWLIWRKAINLFKEIFIDIHTIEVFKLLTYINMPKYIVKYFDCFAKYDIYCFYFYIPKFEKRNVNLWIA